MEQTIEKNELIVQIEQELAEPLKLAAGLVVKDAASVVLATDTLSTLARLRKKIESARLFFTAPLNATLDKYNALFKTISVPAKQVDDGLRNRLLAYRAEQERIRQAEEARLQKEAEDRQKAINKQAAKIGVEAPTVVVPVLQEQAKTVAGSMGGSASVPKDWVGEPIDEKLVPREYCIYSQSLVNQAVKSGVRVIPGVRIYEKERLIIR